LCLAMQGAVIFDLKLELHIRANYTQHDTNYLVFVPGNARCCDI